MGCACCGAKYRKAQAPKPAAPSITTVRRANLYRTRRGITPPPEPEPQPDSAQPVSDTAGQSEDK